MPEGTGSLDTAISALKTVLENLWTVGSLFATFAGLALLASRHGIALSPDILSYCPAALLFGISCITVSVIVLIGEALKKSSAYLSKKYSERSEVKLSSEDAYKNLDTLSDGEILALVAILSAPERKRWDIPYGTEAISLLPKKILVFKGDLGSSVICELEEGIANKREALLKHYSRIINQQERRFSRLKPFERPSIY